MCISQEGIIVRPRDTQPQDARPQATQSLQVDVFEMGPKN